MNASIMATPRIAVERQPSVAGEAYTVSPRPKFRCRGEVLNEQCSCLR